MSTATPAIKLQPEAFFTWRDTLTDAVGWVVLDRIINQISGGGIFMHSNATLEETAHIARNMSLKFTVCDPQIGGAKAGIRFDHKDSRAQEVLRRFIIDHKTVLANVWVTAGDLNTSDMFIESVIRDLGLVTSQGTLGRKIAEVLHQEDKSPVLAKLISTPANEFFPLIEGTVGYGLSEAILICIDQVTKDQPTEMPIAKIDHYIPPSPKIRVVIQGFGAVGSSLAYYLTTRGIAKVVGISDKDGFIHCSSGIDTIKLLKLRQTKVASLKDAPERTLEEHKKNLICNLATADGLEYKIHYRDSHESDESYLERFLNIEAEVISLCASRYNFTNEMLDVALRTTWKNTPNKFLINGANNSLGIYTKDHTLTEDDGRLAERIASNDICLLADWVANSGTAQLFHRGLSVPFVFDNNLALSVLKASAAPIREFILESFKFAHGKKAKLFSANYQLAIKYLEIPRPITAQTIELRTVLSVDDRLRLCLSVGEECQTKEELRSLLARKANPVAYDGFEPSGRMHIAQGILKSAIVNKLTKAGFTYIFWIADWFGYLNNKMGGDLDKIKTVGRYFIEIWKACGMDMKNVKFIWASDQITQHGGEYLKTVIDISSKSSLDRIKRCCTIMGRDAKKMTSSQMLYVLMQCADIFFLKVDVCQLGLDQRKVNMLAREYAEKENITKPIVLSHHMILGLKQGQAKMSKSEPESAIFMEDTQEDIARKIAKAFCPPKIVYEDKIVVDDDGKESQMKVMVNPIMDYYKNIIFQTFDEIIVDNMTYRNYDVFEEMFEEDKLTPQSIKVALVGYLDRLIAPVRAHFESDQHAKALLETVRSYSVTR